MASVDETAKALLELRKDYAEMMLTALDTQTHVLAIEATINAMGPRLQEILAENFAIEQRKLLAKRADFQSTIEIIQKAIETVDARVTPPGLVN